MKAIGDSPPSNSRSKAPGPALDRFRSNRCGMFIHYGLYSLLNRREWVLYDEALPLAQYQALADSFAPRKDAVEEWVRLAAECGMRYACLTTRHHDGFTLFDTTTTDFNAVKSAAGRDLVREFVEACRARGIRPALYYSVGNWSDPGYRAGPKTDPVSWRAFVETVRTQLRELMSHYGPIDYLFYDGCPPPEDWDCESINAELRSLQPELLISDRCGLDEDVASSENQLSPHGKLWECCMTSNTSWGCNQADPNFKSIDNIAYNFFCSVSKGGNFLFNLGPMEDGSIALRDRDLFHGLGRWVRLNQEAVFDTLPNPFAGGSKMLATHRGNTVYAAWHSFQGPETVLTGIANRVIRIRLLATGRTIAFHQNEGRVKLLGLPLEPPDVLSVVAIELDGPPESLENTSPRVFR